MRKIIPLSMALALAVAVVGFTGSAGAQAPITEDTLDCVLTGVAGNLTPGVENIADDAPDGLQDTDSGTYDFGGDAVCAFVDGTDPSPGTLEPTSTTGIYDGIINSTGTYVNTICGTGTATGDPDGTTVEFANNGLVEGPYKAEYNIQFVAGQGVLDITHAENGPGEGPETGDGAGEISIEPSEGNCVTTDVTVFTVQGTFVVTIDQTST